MLAGQFQYLGDLWGTQRKIISRKDAKAAKKTERNLATQLHEKNSGKNLDCDGFQEGDQAKRTRLYFDSDKTATELILTKALSRLTFIFSLGEAALLFVSASVDL